MSCNPFLNPDKRTLIGRFSGKPTKTTKVEKLWQQNIFNYSSHILKQQLASTLLFTWRPFGTCSVRSFVRLRPSGVCRWVTRRVTLRPPWASAYIMSVVRPQQQYVTPMVVHSAPCPNGRDHYFAQAPPLPRRTLILIQVEQR